METKKIIDVRKTQELLRQKIKSGCDATFTGVKIFKMPFNNLFTIGETGSERVLLPYDEEGFQLYTNEILIEGKPLEITYKEVKVITEPKIEYGTCPVCNGTKLESNGDKTVNCSNCGSQYMYGSPKGTTRLRPDGTPCKHSYTSETVSRCYHKYTCKHCGDIYHIDSGD